MSRFRVGSWASCTMQGVCLSGPPLRRASKLLQKKKGHEAVSLKLGSLKMGSKAV